MSVGDIRVKDCYVFFYLCQQMERTTFRDRQGPLLRTRKKEMNLKPSRKLDKRSGRGMLYENEELRMRTIEISAEVDRGQSEVKKLRKENEMLKKEIWWLRDEYDKLEDVVKHMGNIDVSNNNPASAALEEYGRAEGATAATAAISGGQQSWLQITEVQEDDEDDKHDKAKPPADLKFDQIDEDPDAEDSSAVPRMNLVRATLSPELDRQMQEDSFNLDNLLDIANSFNQDNAYGTLELYQSPLIQADLGAAGKNNNDEERRLGASEFAARRTFFQNKMDSPGSEEKPFATLSRRQAFITEKIRSNGCETQVIQEASLNRTRVIPSTDNNAISNAAAGSSCEPAASNSGQTTVTTTCHSGVICSSDNGTVRYRSKSFLFLKPQIRSPSEPPLSASGNPSSHLAAGKFIQSPSGSSSSSSNSPQSPPPTYSAIASSRHSAPYMSPPSLSLLKSSLEGRPSILDNLDSKTSSCDNKPITSPVRVISRATSRVKLSSPAPLIRLCSVDPNTIAIPLIAPSPTPSSTSTTTSATGMLGANEPTLDLVSASGNDPVHQHPPSDHRVSSSSSNACAAATAFSSYADVGAAATATATARAAFSSRRPELTDVTAEEVIDELDSQFGTPTDQLVRAVRVAPEGDVVYVCAATAKTKAAILNKGLSIRGIRVPLIPLARMSRVAYLTGVPDHFSDSTVRVLLTAFAIPVGEVNRRYHRGVDTGDRLVRLLPRPTPSSATPSLTNEPQWTLEEIHLPKFVTAAGARICLSFVESTDSSTDVNIDGTSNVDNKRDSRRFFESARVAEVFSLYKSLPRANKPSASTPIKSIMREKSMSPSKSTPARDVDCRNLMPVVEIQEGKQQPAPTVDTPTKLLGDVNNPAFFKRGSSLMKREPTPNKKVTSPSSASTTKRPAPPVPSTPTNNTASRGSFMQEATRRLTSTFSRNEQPSTPGSAQPSTGNRHWSTVAGGRPSFLRRASGLVPAPSPMGSRRRFRRCTAGSFMVDDDVDCDSETAKSTADGDVISVKSYGSRSKDLPWCGCWGNGCF